MYSTCLYSTYLPSPLPLPILLLPYLPLLTCVYSISIDFYYLLYRYLLYCTHSYLYLLCLKSFVNYTMICAHYAQSRHTLKKFWWKMREKNCLKIQNNVNCASWMYINIIRTITNLKQFIQNNLSKMYDFRTKCTLLKI